MNRNGNNKIFGQNENKMNCDFLKSRENYQLLSYNNFYFILYSIILIRDFVKLILDEI